MPTRRPLRLLLCAALSAGAAGADSLLPNGRFDDATTGTDGWVEVDAFGAIEWDGTRDADGCGASGAAALVHSGPTGASAARFASCAPAVPGDTDYRFAAAFFFPPQDREGDATVEVRFVEGAGCTGAVLASAISPPALSTVENQWVTLSGSASAPPATGSALVVVTLTKKVGGSELIAFLDEVELQPDSELFGDDLEVGAVCRWSAATTE
ncbi:MAG: hypothetical protein AMXMBFR36_14040 [Acidobacteriota bacterium]